METFSSPDFFDATRLTNDSNVSLIVFLLSETVESFLWADRRFAVVEQVWMEIIVEAETEISRRWPCQALISISFQLSSWKFELKSISRRRRFHIFRL